jgi:hypothetical protein
MGKQRNKLGVFADRFLYWLGCFVAMSTAFYVSGSLCHREDNFLNFSLAVMFSMHTNRILKPVKKTVD